MRALKKVCPRELLERPECRNRSKGATANSPFSHLFFFVIITFGILEIRKGSKWETVIDVLERITGAYRLL